MIKGNSIRIIDVSIISPIIPLSLSELHSPQDTIRTSTKSENLLQIPRTKPALSDTITRKRTDQLFQAAEQREKKVLTPRYNETVIMEDTTSFSGSTSRLYTEFIPTLKKLSAPKLHVNDNFLRNIESKTLVAEVKTSDSIKANSTVVPSVEKTKPPTGFQGDVRQFNGHGWYILVLVLSLSIFAWGKALYEKYLVQIINSVYNYQTSIQLFRDKNALFRNLSIILQVLFPINMGLFIFFAIDFYHLKQISDLPFLNILVYSVAVFIFFALKNLIYKFLGLVFKVQEDFSEIKHHMNTFNQTLGVFLLPFIISLPFVSDNLKNVSIIALFIIVGVYLLLFLLRGIQIVNRKHVPIFFLILYLCAVEILPVVLLVKTSYAII